VVRRQRKSDRRRPPQSVPASSGVSPATSLCGDLLSCGWTASRSIPRALAPHRFGASASWFVHHAASRPGAARTITRPPRLPQAFAPLQSLTRRCPHLAGAPLSRGSRPHSATVPRRATAPGVASSGSCCVPAVPAGFDALLPSRSPWCVSTRRAPGVPPFRAFSRGDRSASRRPLPSCDSLPRPPPAPRPKPWGTRACKHARAFGRHRPLSRPGPRFRGSIPPQDWNGLVRISP